MKLGLVNELQIVASDPKSSTLDVLRKALIVSKKLDQTDLSEWITQELRGYDLKDKLPNYRLLLAMIMYNSMNGYQQLSGVRFDVCPHTNVEIRGSVTQIETICKSADEMIKLSPTREENDLLQKFARTQNPDCLFEFYHSVHKSHFFDILESCKTKVLEWALQLEASGIVGENHTFRDEEKQAAANGTTITINNENKTDNKNENRQEIPLYKKKTIWAIIGSFLFLGGVAVWWNWVSGYTFEDVKPLFDTVKSYFVSKI